MGINDKRIRGGIVMSTIMNISPILALVLVLLILYIGDFISILTKAWIPSVFICATLFLAGYWTFFPQDIVARAGINSTLAVIAMYLIITNMGTLLSINDLRKQWKTVLITLSGIVGVVICCMTIGMLFFDFNTVIVAIPSLVGGIVAALIMSDGAKEAGLIDLSIFAIIIYIIQGFAGYPLTSIMLKREAMQVLNKIRAGEGQPYQLTDSQDNLALENEFNQQTMPPLLSKMSVCYNTYYFIIFRLTLVGFLAYLVTELIKPYIAVSPFILCLLFGVIASSVGFLERHPLKKANAFGFVIMILMLFVFSNLNQATPSMLFGFVIPLIVLIGCSVIGLFIFSIIMGKFLGVSLAMSFAMALTSFYGFPADYIITNEVINSVTEDEQERQLLTKHMLAPMLIGGFTSVTIVSVILAGFMVTLITPSS